MQDDSFMKNQVEVNKTDINWLKQGMDELKGQLNSHYKMLITILLALIANIITLITVLA